MYWRRHLFRDGLRWRYEGVVHEYAVCDDPFVEERLDGEYYIDSRRLGARNLDPQKYARDRDLLLAEVERNPDDGRSVFYLAQSYFDLGDFVNAREWYARRVDMGGWDEEVYCAMFRVAESMSQLGAPWPDVQDAYLRAWEFRPTRAEPLHAIAYRYRTDQRYRLGHLFAERAAEIPLPEEDTLFVGADVYAWRAVDEQSVCASWIAKHMEAFMLCRRLLAGRGAHQMRKGLRGTATVRRRRIDAALSYPDVLAKSLIAGPRDRRSPSAWSPGRIAVPLEQMLARSCAPASTCRPGRSLPVVNAGLSAEDRATLLESVTASSNSAIPRPGTGPAPSSRKSAVRSRTVLAASRRGLAVLRTRAFHQAA
jgi:tetratricopeptide (TPR) repeat protein